MEKILSYTSLEGDNFFPIFLAQISFSISFIVQKL